MVVSGPDKGSCKPTLVQRLAHGRQPRPDGERLVGRRLPPGEPRARLVIDAQPLDAGVAALLDEVLHQRRQSLREGLQIGRRAMDAAHRVVAELRVGQPRRVAPHLLEEDIRAVLLVPVEDPV